MVSTLKVNAIKRQSGTTITVAESGDTINVVSGATLDINSGATIDATGAKITGFGGASDEQVKVSSDDTTAGFLNGKLTAGTSITLTEGSGGGDETLAIAYSTPATLPAASGVNLTALNATNLGSGTVPTARLGTGTASSTTVLYGDQTYKTEPSGITQANFLPNAQAIIINGNMDISQRGTAIVDESSSGVYRVDRMAIGMDTLGEVRLQQETLTSGNAFDNGFTKAFRMDCQVADASPASGDNLFVQYKLEGNSVQAFKKGTSNAETFTVAFWVKSNKTVTAQVNLADGDNSRMCSATYAISSGDTWEHKVLNFAADTTGAFTNDNDKSLEIEFALDAGSDFTSGAVPTAWEASSNTDRAVENFSLQDNTANDWAITGLQLEVGTYTSADLPPFQFEDRANNLARCQRYFVKHATTRWIGAYKRQDAFTNLYYKFPQVMRAAPALSSSDLGYFSDMQSSLGTTLSALASYEYDTITGAIIIQISSDYSSTHVFIPSWESQVIDFNAEL